MLENTIENVSGSQKTLLSAGADRHLTVHSLILSNLEENSEIRATVKHFSAAKNKTYPIIQEDIPENEYHHIKTSINLNPGDKIKAISSGGQLSVSLNYYTGESDVQKSFNVEGYWRSTQVYNRLDVVIKDGTSFVATADSITGSGEKPGESELWQPIAYGIRWQGEWDAGRDYRTNDLVSYGEEIWIANQSTDAGREPSHESEYWDFLPLTPQDIEISKVNERVDDLEEQLGEVKGEQIQSLEDDFHQLRDSIRDGTVEIGEIDFGEHEQVFLDLIEGEVKEVDIKELRDDVDYILSGGAGGGGEGGALTWDAISSDEQVSLNAAYLVDSSDGELEITLPRQAGDGDLVRFADKKGTWKLHPVTVKVDEDSDSTIEGEQKMVLDVSFGQVTLVSYNNQWQVVV